MIAINSHKLKDEDKIIKEVLHTALIECMSVLGAESGSLFLFDYAK